MNDDNMLIPLERIQGAILQLRGERIMLDSDLARLYGVETKVLTRAVRRNIERFPADFMFRLSNDEFENLRRHFGTSSQWGGRRTPPYAFTEQGVAMLSSVLRSKQAVQVNIEIIRTFVKLRAMTADNKALARRLNKLEAKYDKQFAVVFDAIREMMNPPEGKKQPIGFVHQEKDNG